MEAIAAKSQNIKWSTSIDGNKLSHKLIRRVSLDKFYALVTGQEDAFFQICKLLPDMIQTVVQQNENALVPHDTVIEELKLLASHYNLGSIDLSIAMSIYMLGFNSYIGFAQS